MNHRQNTGHMTKIGGTQGRIYGNKEQLVITETIVAAGCVSYWRIASDTNLSTLAAAWKKHGLVEDALPTPPKDEVALGRAVADQADKRRLVRPLARRGAWAVVEEKVHKDDPQSEYMKKPVTYRVLMTIAFANGVAQPAMQGDATSEEFSALVASIHDAYAAHRNTFAHSDISSWLLDIAYKLGAVSLRDSGGVYFIPRKNVDEWNKVADALDEAGSTIFRIPAMRTAEAVAAITDALTAEAATLAQKIEDELQVTGEEALGKRALKNRVTESMALLEKISTYEELIGKQLEIRQRVESLSANVTAAALMAQTTEAV